MKRWADRLGHSAGLLVLASTLSAGIAAAPIPANSAIVAIIIDDLGYRGSEAREMLALPREITVSILPHTPFARELAEGAHARGMEVMLHLPLQPADGSKDAGPGSINLDTRADGLSSLLDNDLLSVPYVVGVNNHMGSLLTRHPGHMTWLMRALRSKHLFFVDSFTTPGSVALKMAREVGVRAVRRNVFLDTDPDPGAISAEFDRLLMLARKDGYAVAIGHPYPATLKVLHRRLPELQHDGIRLVPASQLINVAYGGSK